MIITPRRNASVELTKEEKEVLEKAFRILTEIEDEIFEENYYLKSTTFVNEIIQFGDIDTARQVLSTLSDYDTIWELE